MKHPDDDNQAELVAALRTTLAELVARWPRLKSPSAQARARTWQAEDTDDDYQPERWLQ